MKSSLAVSLAFESVSKRETALQGLSPEQLVELHYDWRFWGRPDQQLPPGEWFVWLIMTGRGWGKTRTAVENIARMVKGETPIHRAR